MTAQHQGFGLAFFEPVVAAIKALLHFGAAVRIIDADLNDLAWRIHIAQGEIHFAGIAVLAILQFQLQLYASDQLGLLRLKLRVGNLQQKLGGDSRIGGADEALWDGQRGLSCLILSC